MYNTCEDDSSTLKKLTSVNLAEKAPTDLKYNFYSLHNPKEYLTGSDAILVEQGPYVLRKHSVVYNVAQTQSTLTEETQPNSKGNLEYSTANAYLVLDKDIKSTTNLQRKDDLSLAFSGDKVTLPQTKRVLASHLSMSDSVANYSPDYLSLLGTFNDEVNLILSLECTADQIANIGVAGKAQCSSSQLGDSSVTNCACCMMDNDFKLATSRNTGVSPPFKNCNSFFDDDGSTMSMLSQLASHDGGIAVKSSGEKKYDGSGASTSSDFYTALIQEHTVNDLLFGFPSAFLGNVAFRAQMDQAEKSLSSPLSSIELSKKMLTGQMDDNLSFKLGDIAKYTSDVGSVCFATCLTGEDCSDNAPERHELSDVDKIKLGGIDCMPYTSTYKTAAKCVAIDIILSQNPSAAGYEACVCANESDEWSSQGCCLAGGRDNGESLAGEGCLYEVAGIVDPNYAGMDTSVANAIDLGSALQAWIGKEAASTSSEFMCPAAGQELDEHALFGSYEKFGGDTGHVTYYHTGFDRIRQDDVTNSASEEFITPVSGGSGRYFVPKGLFMKVGTAQISDGIPIDAAHQVFVPSAKKSIDFEFEGVRDNFVRNKVCGTDTCIVSARLSPSNTTFHASNATDGAGLPFAGLQPVGQVRGPSINGRPEYLHHPLFFGGDELLYTQQANTYVEREDGNGIKIYKPMTKSDPGSFDPDATESNYQLVDKDVVDSQSDSLLSHVDIEVATGLGARQRMRFGTSYSIWECNPDDNEKCKLAVNSQAQYSCYSTSGSGFFDELSNADKEDLKILGYANFTYPCSAANLLTPHVVGGKILPNHWVEESTIHASKAEIDLLAAYARAYSKSGNTFILTLGLVFISMFTGISALFRCLCFETRHSFMETEMPTAQTTKTSSVSKQSGGIA